MQNKLWLLPLAFFAFEAAAEDAPPVIRVKPQVEHRTSTSVKIRVTPDASSRGTRLQARAIQDNPFAGIVVGARPYSDVAEEDEQDRDRSGFRNVKPGNFFTSSVDNIPNTQDKRKLFVSDDKVHRAKFVKYAKNDEPEEGSIEEFPAEGNPNIKIPHSYQGDGGWASLPDVTQYDSIVAGRDPFEQLPPPKRSDPLILDMQGNGIDLRGPSSLTRFDVNGDGVAEMTGWTKKGSDDSFLCIDRNNDGRISDGNELFGLNRVLGEQGNGFELLKKLDKDSAGKADGIFDANDVAYPLVKVWRDINGDAQSVANELQSLSQAGIVAINLQYETSGEYLDSHYNQLREHSTFKRLRKSGAIAELDVVNVWFANHIVR